MLGRSRVVAEREFFAAREKNAQEFWDTDFEHEGTESQRGNEDF